MSSQHWARGGDTSAPTGAPRRPEGTRSADEYGRERRQAPQRVREQEGGQRHGDRVLPAQCWPAPHDHAAHRGPGRRRVRRDADGDHHHHGDARCDVPEVADERRRSSPGGHGVTKGTPPEPRRARAEDDHPQGRGAERQAGHEHAGHDDAHDHVPDVDVTLCDRPGNDLTRGGRSRGGQDRHTGQAIGKPDRSHPKPLLSLHGHPVPRHRKRQAIGSQAPLDVERVPNEHRCQRQFKQSLRGPVAPIWAWVVWPMVDITVNRRQRGGRP